MATRDVPPSAPALMVSMRGLGYALETAVADLIDNSISARAKRIDVQFDWRDGDPVLSMHDDGDGIAPDRIVDALRFGGTGLLPRRSPTDLGRFGLGLKTASLSQCRRLTVATRSKGGRSVITWDVDHVLAAEGRWEALEDEYTGPAAAMRALEARPAGTLVVWEKVDFGRAEDRPQHGQFLRDLERVELHLGMVFWQFLVRRSDRVAIGLNGRTVEGWDPFGSALPATISFPEQRLRSPGGAVTVRGYVLPHKDRFARPEDYDRAGGPDGWTAQQGLYVYRGGRLLVAGGWMGLGRGRAWVRDEPSRLARIRLEIPNTADHEWHIDVRKSTARPPDLIRPELQRIAEDVRRRAREVFVHRGHGRRGSAGSVSRLWRTAGEMAGARYRIDRDHDLVKLVRGKLGRDKAALDGLLDLIERTVPVERVWLDVTERSVEEPEPVENAALVEQARTVLNLFLGAGLTRAEAEEKVCRMDPFDGVPELRRHLGRSKGG